MKRLLLLLFLIAPLFALKAQKQSMSIGDTDVKQNAVLYLKGDGSQGLIIPIVSTLGNFGEAGMIVYSNGKLNYHTGSSWVELGAGGGGGGNTYSLSINGNELILKRDGNNQDVIKLSDNIPSGANELLLWDGGKWTSVIISGDAANVNGVITVNGIKGKTIPALPNTTQALVYNGTNWVFQPVSSGGTVTSINTGTGLTGGPVTTTGTISVNTGTGANQIPQLDGTGKLNASVLPAGIDANTTDDITSTTTAGGDLNGLYPNPAVGRIQGRAVANTAPTDQQVLKWNQTQNRWEPASDNTGSAALPPGQILVGNASNVATGVNMSGDATITNTGAVTISNNTITSAKITDGTVATSDLATGAVTSTIIADGTIAAADLSSMSATGGQVLQYNGTAWVPATVGGSGTVTNIATGTGLSGGPITGTGTISLANTLVTPGSYGNATNVAQVTVDAQGRITAASNIAITPGSTTLDGLTDATVTATSSGELLINDGAGQFRNRTMSGDATLNSTGAVTINAGAVNSAKIADGTIAASDLAGMGATNGQVLQYNGSNWIPASVGTGTVTNIATGTGLSGGPITGTGTVSLANTTVTPGSYGNATNVAQIQVDAQGRIISASSVAITAGATTLDGLTDATVTGASSGQILVNDGSGQFQNRTVSGDASFNNTGAVTISNGVVNSAKITDATITSTDIATGTITSGNIADGTIAAVDFNNMGASNGQVLKFNAGAWAPAAENTGISTTLTSGNIIVGSVSNIASPVSMGGDASISNTGSVTIAPNTVTTGKILDGTITDTDINTSASIAVSKLATGTNGQMLTVSGGVPSWQNAPAPSGTAGGDLIGTYPSPTLGSGVVDATNLAASAVTSSSIAPSAVDDTKISNVAPGKLTQSGATAGQVLKWDGFSWAPQADNVGGGGAPTLSPGQIIVGNGTSNSGVTVGQDATLNSTNGNITVQGLRGVPISPAAPTLNSVLQFNGTNYAPIVLAGGGTVSSIATGTGLTGGPITSTGTIAIAPNGITSAELASGSVDNSKITNNAVNSLQILDATITNADINASAGIAVTKLAPGSNGQVLTINAGTPAWLTPAAGLTNPMTGNNDLIIGGGGGSPVRLAAPGNNQILTTNGTGIVTWTPQTNFLSGNLNSAQLFVGSASNIATPVTMSGDGTLSNAGALTISNNVITSGKIADGTITGIDISTGTVTSTNIADGTIAAADLNSMTATSGQVLKYNGTNWAPAADNTGAATTASNGLNITGNDVKLGGTLSANTDIVQGTFNLSLTGTGRMGIGTNTPASKLDVEGGVTVGATYSGVTAAPTNGALIEGNVGIGTTAVVNRLDVDGAAVIGTSYAGINTAPVNGLLVQGNLGLGTATSTNKLDVEGALAVGAAYSGNIAAPANGAIFEGNVGIGTNAPTQKLEISNASNPTIRIKSNLNQLSHLELLESGTTFGTDALGFRLTYDGATDVFKISSGVSATVTDHFVIDRGAQRIGIGRNPTTANFEVQGNSYFTGNIGILTTTPTHDLTIKQSSNVTTSDAGVAVVSATSTNYWKYHTTGTLLRFSYFNGSILNTDLYYQSGDASWTFTSDRRLKSGIEPIESVLDKISQLKPVKFYYTSNQQRKNGKLYGFIAQDVEPIFPSLVHSPSEENPYYGMTYENISVIAIKAIQEQQELINQQQAEIEKLKKEIETARQANTTQDTKMAAFEAELTEIKKALGMEAKAQQNK